MTETDLLDSIEAFYTDYYREDIALLAQRYPDDQQRLVISVQDIATYDDTLAEDTRENPAQMREYFEEALRLYDLPADVSFDDATVSFTGLRETHIYSVDEVRAEQSTELVGVEGHISRVTSVKPEITHAAFECQRCGTITRVIQDGPEFQEPHQCNGCERQGPFRIDYDQSEFINRRKMQIKQPPEDVAGGGEGVTITVYLKGEVADPPHQTLEERVGEDVTVYGEVRLDQTKNGNTKTPVFDQYLVGHTVSFERDNDEIDVAEYEDEFKQAANSENAYQLFLSSMAEDIYPYGRWPLAIRLGAAYVMGGVRVSPEGSGGSTYRGDIHMAIVGPPGVGKSKFSKNIAELSPGCEHRSATGLSSDVGLTAAAVQDDFAEGDGWVLKPGILPRAEDHAILDEADKTQANLSKINDALEGEQMASIDKGGISAKLKTRVGLLTMANPDGGRWDEQLGIKEQVDIDDSLWSRFDGIVLLEDQPDEEQDGELADHVLKNYRHNLERQESDDDTESEQTAPVSFDAVRAWVKYARENVTPRLTDEATAKLKEYYVDIRNDDAFAKNSHPTARKLEAGIRFSTAFARIRLSDVVSASDVQMAIELSKELLGQTLNGGTLDADAFTEAVEHAQKDRRERIAQCISDEAKTPEEIKDELGIALDVIESDLEKWYRRTNPAPVTKTNDGYRWIA